MARLEELGISESMLMEHREKGGRSAVIGTYRILMYRATCDECDEAVATLKQSMETLAMPTCDSKVSSRKSIKSTKSTRSTKSNKSVEPPTSEEGKQSTDEEKQSESAHMSSSSPSHKSKLKHKLRFSLRKGSTKKKPNAAASSGSPSLKPAKKKRDGSNMCTIL